MDKRIDEIISYYQSKPYSTQSSRAYDMLLEMIALEALPGKRVYTEQELGQMLQIGRTPLRDALKLLEFDRIIKTTPRLGIEVRKIRVEDYCLQAEVRTVLEKVVIQRACRLATKNSREELKSLNDSFAANVESGDRLGLYRVDCVLHKLIDECSQNPYAVHALEPLRFFEQRVHYLLWQIYPEVGKSLNQEHIDYVNSIIEGNEETACIHFENMVANTLKLVQLQILNPV